MTAPEMRNPLTDIVELIRTAVRSELDAASLAAPAHPIPSSRSWELAILPDVDSIATAATALFEQD